MPVFPLHICCVLLRWNRARLFTSLFTDCCLPLHIVQWIPGWIPTFWIHRPVLTMLRTCLISFALRRISRWLGLHGTPRTAVVRQGPRRSCQRALMAGRTSQPRGQQITSLSVPRHKLLGSASPAGQLLTTVRLIMDHTTSARPQFEHRINSYDTGNNRHTITGQMGAHRGFGAGFWFCTKRFSDGRRD